MTVMDAEGIYASGGPGALRLSTRGAVRLRQREGRVSDILPEVAVPLVRLASALRLRGQDGPANDVLEHAVHDGVQAAVLAHAVAVATTSDVVADSMPPEVHVGPLGDLYVGPPPAATDLGTSMALANHIRDRLLTF